MTPLALKASQAVPFQPFLLAGLKTGLDLSLPPWLLPKDGFAQLDNCYLLRAVLCKRPGYERIGPLYRLVSSLIATGDGIVRQFTGNFPNPSQGGVVFECNLLSSFKGYFDGPYFDGYFDEPIYTNIRAEAQADHSLKIISGLILQPSLSGAYPTPWEKTDSGSGSSQLMFDNYSRGNRLYSLRMEVDNGGASLSDVRMGAHWYEFFVVDEEQFTISFDVLASKAMTGLKVAFVDDTGTNLLEDNSFNVTKAWNRITLNLKVKTTGICKTLPCFYVGNQGFDYWVAFSNLSMTKNTGVGTYNPHTGDYDVTFPNTPYVGCPVNVTNQIPSPNAVVGLDLYLNNVDIDEMVAFDRTRLFRFSREERRFNSITEDIWTGGNSDLFSLVNWLNKAYICNGIDNVKVFDGTTVANLTMNLLEDGTSKVDSALFIVPFKDRLIAFRTKEDGKLYGSRARWCRIGQPEDWTNDDFVDAPTSEKMMGFSFLRNNLIVFFEKSFYGFEYTGDSRLPFRWNRLSSKEGSSAQKATVEFHDEVIAFGRHRVISTNGLEVKYLDDKIPRLLWDVYQPSIFRICAGLYEDFGQVWMSYPSSETPDTLNDRVMVINYLEGSFSTYKGIRACCMTLFREYDYYDLIFGDEEGGVWKVNQNLESDDGDDIDMEARTSWMNPFVAEGIRCDLGWVDFLLMRDAATLLSFDFYVDFKPDPYLTVEDVSIAGEVGSDQERIWVRIPVGQTGEFHQIAIRNSGTGQLVKIEAIVPWFAKAGRISG